MNSNKKPKKYEQYDVFVLLCAGGWRESEFFTTLDKKDNYLGGKKRMKAAIKICKETKKKIIVVGGGFCDDKNRFKKVNRMKKELRKNRIKKERIIRLVSKKDTLGNLRALYDKLVQRRKFQKRKEEKEKIETGIITNYYHISRMMKMAQDIFINTNVHCMPITAEAVIKDFQIKPFEQEFLKRVRGEEKGICDWENKQYREQTPKTYVGIIHPKDDQSIIYI